MRLKVLLLNYKNYNSKLDFDDILVSNFTDDELYEMDSDDEDIVRKSKKINAINRVKKLKEEGFDFIENPEFIDTLVLETLSDNEILELSDKAKTKIKKLIYNKGIFSYYDSDDKRYTLSRKIHGVAKKDEFFRNVFRR